MTKWDYKELGFTDEQAMNESIARVTERMNSTKTDTELEVERRSELQAQLKANNNQLDTTKVFEEARQSQQDIRVHNKIIEDKEQAKQLAKQKQMQDLFKAAGKSMREENELKAQREMEKERDRLEAELQKEIHSKHGVKTDKEKKSDEAYSNMLENLNI